jgi:cytochrome c biogenesis protein CcdA
MVFISGFAYTLGRTAAYAVLGWLIIHSLLSIPQVAQFLQTHMGKILGPLLIISGLFLLEAISLRLPGLSLPQEHHNNLVESGAPGAFILGLVFALAFCPLSAALFLGSLIPSALSSKAGALLSVIYGAGTGIPVLLFAVAIALGVSSLSHWFHRVTKLEYYTRRMTWVIFILVGLYYTWFYIMKLF